MKAIQTTLHAVKTIRYALGQLNPAEATMTRHYSEPTQYILLWVGVKGKKPQVSVNVTVKDGEVVGFNSINMTDGSSNLKFSNGPDSDGVFQIGHIIDREFAAVVKTVVKNNNERMKRDAALLAIADMYVDEPWFRGIPRT